MTKDSSKKGVMPTDINICPSVEALVEAGFYVGGPGVLTYHFGKKEHLYVLYANKNVLDVKKALKAVLHVTPLRFAHGLYTDMNGSYYLCEKDKPSLDCKGSILLANEGGVLKGVCQSETIPTSMPSFDDWKPVLRNSTRVPYMLYFLDRVGVTFTHDTLYYVLSELRSLAMSSDDEQPDAIAEFQEFWNLYSKYM